VYGDNAYGTGEFHEYLAANDIDSRCKTQQPTAAGGMFTKADFDFDIDLDTDTVTCPNGVSTPIRRNSDGDGIAAFGQACADCPLRAQYTKAQDGRTISVGRYERRLATPVPSSRIRGGSPTTGPPAPRSSASSLT
jgi:hypothetical protein